MKLSRNLSLSLSLSLSHTHPAPLTAGRAEVTEFYRVSLFFSTTPPALHGAPRTSNRKFRSGATEFT